MSKARIDRLDSLIFQRKRRPRVIGFTYASSEVHFRSTESQTFYRSIMTADDSIKCRRANSGMTGQVVVCYCYCYTAVFSVVTQRSSSGEERCVTTLKTAVQQTSQVGVFQNPGVCLQAFPSFLPHPLPALLLAPFFTRSLTLVPRSLLLNRTETLATQAK